MFQLIVKWKFECQPGCIYFTRFLSVCYRKRVPVYNNLLRNSRPLDLQRISQAIL